MERKNCIDASNVVIKRVDNPIPFDQFIKEGVEWLMRKRYGIDVEVEVRLKNNAQS